MKLKFKHFIFLNALDVALSFYAFTHMNGLRELNPFYIELFAIFGIGIALIIGKLLGIILIWAFYKSLPLNKKINDKYTINMKKVSVGILCMFMCFVVLNNIYQIATQS